MAGRTKSSGGKKLRVAKATAKHKRHAVAKATARGMLLSMRNAAVSQRGHR